MADEDDLLLLNDFINEYLPHKIRKIEPRPDPFEQYDEEKFRERFRLSKTVVLMLLEQVC